MVLPARQAAPSPTNRSGVATTQPQGVFSPVAAVGTLKGIAYAANSQMTLADYTRENPYLGCVRIQLHAADFNGDLNGINENIDRYYNAGIKLIYCCWEDNVAGLGSSDPIITQANYNAFCVAVANRWPNMLALEVCNEINYHYTGANYLTVLTSAYAAIKTAQPNLTVLHSNVDDARFSQSDVYFSLGTTAQCDAVGFHGYKALGNWDADIGPTRKYGTTSSWGQVPAEEISKLVTAWCTSYHNTYGAITPIDNSGKKFICTEIGIKWKGRQGTDPMPVVTASQGAVSAGPPAGDYYYFLVGLNSSFNPVPGFSALSETVKFTADGAHATSLSWPATNNLQITNWHIWRFKTNDARDIWDPVVADGAPYNVGNGFTYGYLAEVTNSATANTFTDTAATASTPAHTYFGDTVPRGFVSGDGMYGEAWVAAQIPKIIAEYRKAKADAVCIYIGRSSFYNGLGSGNGQGVFDDNYEDTSRMVHNDGTTTTIWDAFKTA